jgi:hypothetical protein
MDIIEQRVLENEMILTVYDQSKKMVGDRWLIRIVCEVTIPVDEDFFSRIPEADLDLQEEIRASMAGSVKFSVVKEKTFVAETERFSLVDLMTRQIRENMITYLNRPEFPKRLFIRRYGEFRTACDTARHYRYLQEANHAGDDPDAGPTDFSACFKD